jgi:(1->4)-alpha-D-glucan 1-alpha-D-glucosylmutase
VEIADLARRMARFGFLNSLAQTLCKLTAPGVPDIYQGNEIWDDSLVDPDNRRPVDYDLRRRLLADVKGWTSREHWQTGLASLEDGRCKLFVTFKTLEFRRAQEALFRDGAYVPLAASGGNAQHLLAYARQSGEHLAIVVVPRLSARLLAWRETLPLGVDVWGDTRIDLPRRLRFPEAGPLRNVLTGELIEPERDDAGIQLIASSALSSFPVALLVQA